MINVFHALATLLLVGAHLGAEESMNFILHSTQAEQIGQLIWENECRGKVEQLTWWNEGEDFASMGIHHFIWYPKDKKGPYEETFPELLHFMQKNSVVLPGWLEDHPPCPWSSRKEFMRDFTSNLMIELRKFLLRTRRYQVQFMAERLQHVLPKVLKNPHVKKQLHRILQCKKGNYILLDYYNFKGAGISPSEQYQGRGWGLLQVLEEMEEGDDQAADAEFVRAARIVLERRVDNAPPERNERQWLVGWIRRLKTYQ